MYIAGKVSISVQYIVPIGLVAIIALTFSCKERSSESLLGANQPISVEVSDSDLPIAGRSRFDFFTARYGLPTDFSQFVKILKKTQANESSGFLYELIPHGRSLQRNATDHTEPRVLLFPEYRTNNDCPKFPTDQIFLAFSARAKSMEAISYNDAMGRYEFQIVKPYSKGTAPEIFYARRTFCKTCHQYGGPIFSSVPWSETLNAPKTRKAIASALTASHPQQLDDFPHYHGIGIGPAMGGTFFVDGIMEDAAEMILLQNMWRNVCGDDEDEVSCKRLAIKLALFRLLFPNHRTLPKDFDRFAAEYNDIARKTWPLNGIAVPNLRIPDREGKPYERLPAYLDPLTPRKPLMILLFSKVEQAPQLGRETGGPARFVDSIMGFTFSDHAGVIRKRLIKYSQNSWKRILEPVDSKTIDILLKDPVFKPRALVNVILKQLGAPTISKACYINDADRLNPLAIGGESLVLSTKSKGTEESLLKGLFSSYCGSCHVGTGDPKLDFMENHDKLLSKLSLDPRVLERLEWPQNLPIHSQMPPVDSEEGRRIRSPEYASDRQRMIIGLKMFSKKRFSQNLQ